MEIEYKTLPVGLLSCDMYQRELNERKVRTIINNFDNAQVRPIYVSERDGSYFIIDGQHTAAALIRMNGPRYKAECKLFHGLTVEQEADMFSKLNTNSTKPNASAVLNAKHIAGDKQANEYFQILERNNIPYEFVKNGGHGKLICHASCLNYAKKYGTHNLEDALRTIRKYFSHDRLCYSYFVIGGISILFSKCEIDVNRLGSILQRSSVDEVKRNSMLVNSTISHSSQHMEKATAIAIANMYNKNIKISKNRIDVSVLYKEVI